MSAIRQRIKEGERFIRGRTARGRRITGKASLSLESTIISSGFTFQQEQAQQLDALSEENLHEALISLGLSGSNELFDQRIQLKNHYEGIYRPRGRKQPLNQALVAYQKAAAKDQRKRSSGIGFSATCKASR